MGVELKTIDVVAAVIIHDDKLFCAKRKDSKYIYLSNKFEFPGGKVELGESDEDALKREIIEELGRGIEIISKLADYYYQYPHQNVHLKFYICKFLIYSDLIESNSHNLVGWYNINEINDLDWIIADKPVVHTLTHSKEISFLNS